MDKPNWENSDLFGMMTLKRSLFSFKDETLKDIIERAREMEDKYGHFFDYILVNQDMDRAYNELLEEINRLEVEPQWVPIQWVDS